MRRSIEDALRSVFGERFVDARGAMPTHATLRYETRSAAAIRALVVHHSATRANVSWEAVARYHVGHHGWPGIGYHFGVSQDGVAYLGALETIRYHAREANATSVGICCAGDYGNTVPPGGMVEQLSVLMDVLETYLDQPLLRLGHRDVVDTTCPGDRLYELINKQEWLPEDEAPAPPAVLAEKVRWWMEEYVRQEEGGNAARAQAILLSLTRLDDGLLYRLERSLKGGG